MLENTISSKLTDNCNYFKDRLGVSLSFDVQCRELCIGGKRSVVFYVEGFCNEDSVQNLMQYFLGLKKEEMPELLQEFLTNDIPLTGVQIESEKSRIEEKILSGIAVLFVDGFDKAILLDVRSYPARNVNEPEKDRALRGSRDGFVETLIMNTTLIRRRIRSSKLNMEAFTIGASSRTEVALCYMDDRVDKNLLKKVRERIENVKVDALVMNQESLAECLYKHPWFNPFPKFRFTERPDTASAQILEGNIVILIDNSPSAMIFPNSLFDMMEDADDYYFPPITGTYLRLTRYLISIIVFFLTPTFLLLQGHPEWVSEGMNFILVKDDIHVPLLMQFLILELAIDGLRLAAVHTPSMLSTPLSVMAGIVLGEFSVKSGWFNSEVMLYMAFVAIANYTQANYELDYARKFLRIIMLVLTALLGLPGYILGILLAILVPACNRTFSGKPYLYPLIPLYPKELFKRLFRRKLKG